MGEIAENCQGVKLVLVALKCDLREKHTDEEEESGANGLPSARKEKDMIDYNQGLEVARRINALRYLGMFDTAALGWGPWMLTIYVECSAKRNRGVNEAFSEATRVALSVKGSGSSGSSSKCTVM